MSASPLPAQVPYSWEDVGHPVDLKTIYEDASNNNITIHFTFSKFPPSQKYLDDVQQLIGQNYIGFYISSCSIPQYNKQLLSTVSVHSFDKASIELSPGIKLPPEQFIANGVVLALTQFPPYDRFSSEFQQALRPMKNYLEWEYNARCFAPRFVLTTTTYLDRTTKKANCAELLLEDASGVDAHGDEEDAAEGTSSGNLPPNGAPANLARDKIYPNPLANLSDLHQQWSGEDLS